jgi:hypothetical protein
MKIKPKKFFLRAMKSLRQYASSLLSTSTNSTGKNLMILGLYKTRFNKNVEYRIILWNDHEKANVLCTKPHTFPGDLVRVEVTKVDEIYQGVLT